MANVNSPAVSLSSADVPPQHRFVDSDREQSLVFTTATAADAYTFGFVPQRRIQVTGVVLKISDVPGATATTTYAVDVDVFDNGATVAKTHDVAAQAAVALGADKFLAISVSTVVANTICEATEQLVVKITLVGTVSPATVTIRYIDLALSDEGADWTA